MERSLFKGGTSQSPPQRGARSAQMPVRINNDVARRLDLYGTAAVVAVLRTFGENGIRDGTCFRETRLRGGVIILRNHIDRWVTSHMSSPQMLQHCRFCHHPYVTRESRFVLEHPPIRCSL